MVDFNNEATVGTPAVDIVRVLILQARANVYEALEQYYKQKFRGVKVSLNVVKARLITWFLEHSAYIYRVDKEKHKELSQTLFKNKLTETEVLEVINFLNELLDNLRLIRLDTKKTYDRTKIEAENEAHDV